MTRPLSDLEQTDDFLRRHIGPDADDVAKMLEVVGVADLDDLIEQAVPASIRGSALGLGRSAHRGGGHQPLA